MPASYSDAMLTKNSGSITHANLAYLSVKRRAIPKDRVVASAIAFTLHDISGIISVFDAALLAPHTTRGAERGDQHPIS